MPNKLPLNLPRFYFRIFYWEVLVKSPTIADRPRALLRILFGRNIKLQNDKEPAFFEIHFQRSILLFPNKSWQNPIGSFLNKLRIKQYQLHLLKSYLCFPQKEFSLLSINLMLAKNLAAAYLQTPYPEVISLEKKKKCPYLKP